MRRTSILLILLLGAAAVGCEDATMQPPPLPDNAISPSAILGQAEISGRVVFTGDVPEPEPINMGSDAACARKHQA